MPAPKSKPVSLLCALKVSVAAASIALVLALAALAVSPEAHARLHNEADHQNHACAVTLFAHGVFADITPVEAVMPEPAWQAPIHAEARVLFLQVPRYLRLPERAPPATT